ncbi:MAG: hypothetical protein ACHQNT_12220 [Bacteroidia bacterium]
MMKKIEPIEKIKALLVIVTGLVILFFIFKGKGFLYAAAIIGVASLAIPIAGDGIIWLWFKIAEVLGWINSRILLSLIFYIFLFPIALLARAATKSKMHLKRVKDNSVYDTRNHKYTGKDLENIW